MSIRKATFSMAISMVAAMAFATAAHAGFLYVPPEDTVSIQADAGRDTLPQPESGTADAKAGGLGTHEAAVAKPGPHRWHVRSGEMLREALDRWGSRAGVGILFLTNRRYRLLEGRSFAGSFGEATQALFSALSYLPHRPVGEHRGAGRTLAVLHGARPDRVPSSGRRPMRAAAILLLVAGVLAAASPPMPEAAAHDEAAGGADQGSALITALRAGGARVMALGERGGLEGHFVELADGDAYGLYLTADGHAVAGLLYGPDGTLLTGRQIAAAGGERTAAAGTIAGGGERRAARDGEVSAPGRAHGSEESAGDLRAFAHAYTDGPNVSSVEAPGRGSHLLHRSLGAFGFSFGRTGPAVAVFADPGCRWSRAAVARLGAAALDGRLRLRVVPVGVLGAASVREAAAIASAGDPALAWFEGTHAAATAAGARRIERNNALFDAWEAGAVPLIAWRARDGHVAYRIGDIDDPAVWLEGLSDE